MYIKTISRDILILENNFLIYKSIIYLIYIISQGTKVEKIIFVLLKCLMAMRQQLGDRQHLRNDTINEIPELRISEW